MKEDEKIERVNNLGKGLAEIIAKMDDYKESNKHKSIKNQTNFEKV